jgi:hypothetical protein
MIYRFHVFILDIMIMVGSYVLSCVVLMSDVITSKTSTLVHRKCTMHLSANNESYNHMKLGTHY